MRMKGEAEVTVTIDLDEIDEDVLKDYITDPATGEERQAQVFIEMAALAQTWGTSPSMQWFYIGKHLRDCACSTWEARDMVKEIAEVLEAKP